MLRTLKKAILAPQSLREDPYVDKFFVPLLIYVLTIFAYESTLVLPIFTGLHPSSWVIILGSRENGLRFTIPYYLPLLLIWILVPLKVIISGSILFALSKLFASVTLNFKKFISIFSWILQIKSLEYLFLTALSLLKLKDFKLTLYRGHFDIISFLVFYNLAIAVSDDESSQKKLLPLYFSAFLLFELLVLLVQR